jgi:hypothetical protein
MFAIVFKCFSGVFASVLGAYFKCFICLLWYVASECLKNRSGVAHGICVGSGRWRKRCSGWRGQRLGRRRPTVGALPRKPDAI